MVYTPEEAGMMAAEAQSMGQSERAFDAAQTSQMDAGQIRWQLDSEDIMKRFVADMLRCDIDKKGNLIRISYAKQVVGKDKDGNRILTTVKEELDPLINDAGLKDLKAFMSPYLSKNMYLSEFNNFEIADMIKETMINVLGTLYSNYKEYEIETHNLSMVSNIVFNYIYAAAKRAEGGAEKRFLSTINRTVEHKLTKTDDSSKDKSLSGFLRSGK